MILLVIGMKMMTDGGAAQPDNGDTTKNGNNADEYARVPDIYITILIVPRTMVIPTMKCTTLRCNDVMP